MGVKSPFFRRWFADWREFDKAPVIVTTLQDVSKLPSKNIHNSDIGFDIFAGSLLKKETYTHSKGKKNEPIRKLFVSNSGEILKNAVLLDSNVSLPDGNKSNNTMIMHSFYNVCEYNNQRYLCKIYVEEFLENKEILKRAYEAKDIIIKPIPSSKSNVTTFSPQPARIGSVKIISDLFSLVKTYEKEFKPKPNSLVLNEDGTPKIMYRGDAEEFTVFDRKKSKYSNLYGSGFYFTDSKAHAMQYGNAREFYLNIRNPLKPNQHKITQSQLTKFLELVAEDENYDIYNYGTTNVSEIVNSIYGKGDFEMLQDVSATAIGDLVETIELFNAVNNTDYDGVILPTETVVYNPNNIKSVENGGTFSSWDDDIYYSKENVANGVKSGYNKNIDQYKVMWTIEEGVLDRREVKQFYDFVGEKKRGNKICREL